MLNPNSISQLTQHYVEIIGTDLNCQCEEKQVRSHILWLFTLSDD